MSIHINLRSYKIRKVLRVFLIKLKGGWGKSPLPSGVGIRNFTGEFLYEVVGT